MNAILSVMVGSCRGKSEEVDINFDIGTDIGGSLHFRTHTFAPQVFVFSSYFYEGLLQNAQLAYSKGKVTWDKFLMVSVKL